MDYDNELFKQVLVELKSYVPVMLPVLLIYSIEVRAHLRVWHAVRQLPHLEKEPVQDDFEAGTTVSSKQALEIRGIHKSVQSIARQQWIFKFVFVLIFAAIVLFDQFVSVNGWLNRAKKDEGFTGYNGSINDFDVEAESQSGYGYRWYYDSMLGQIDWAKSYYFITLILPSVFLLGRTLSLLLGVRDRIVLRNTNGCPFIKIAAPTDTDRLIAICYRMDHAFAHPEELLVGGPNIVAFKDAKTGAELIGTRIPYCSRRSCSSPAFPSSSSSSHSSSSEGGCCRFRRRPRWAKTYFRTCLLSWLLAYALTAYLKVKGYIATDAESAGLYVSFFFPPIASVAIMLRAAAKGRAELKKIWTYKEDWVNAGKELDALQSGSGAVAGCENEAREEGKVLLSEERHIELEKVEE
ncbi:hypothetical protein ACEPAH_2753 [Sanghuangporus vaninii]